jgi:predicted methyltransferase
MKLLFSLLLTCLAGTIAAADDFSATETKIKAAMDHERRADDKERDQNRSPVETLKFLKFRDDMTVLELLPGGGWYTKLLGPVLKEDGKLYISIGAERTFDKIKDDADFSAVEIIPFDRENFVRTPGVRRVKIPEFSFGIKKVDLALTFRNLHNFDEEGRKNMNKAVFEALKHKGLYGVVDHTRRHMQGDGNEVWRRMDPVLVIREVEAAGFEFVDFSDLHYRADDELRYEVGRKSVTGNTDRFTLLFRKP